MHAQPWRHHSLFFEIFPHHVPLSIASREALAELQQTPNRLKKGCVIKNRDANLQQQLAIQDGWACSCRVSEKGRRQIIALYLPGDIVGYVTLIPMDVSMTSSC